MQSQGLKCSVHDPVSASGIIPCALPRRVQQKDGSPILIQMVIHWALLLARGRNPMYIHTQKPGEIYHDPTLSGLDEGK